MEDFIVIKYSIYHYTSVELCRSFVRKPGDAIILEEGMIREEAAKILDAEETGRFGETKQFIRQQVFDVDGLIRTEEGRPE